MTATSASTSRAHCALSARRQDVRPRAGPRWRAAAPGRRRSSTQSRPCRPTTARRAQFGKRARHACVSGLTSRNLNRPNLRCELILLLRPCASSSPPPRRAAPICSRRRISHSRSCRRRRRARAPGEAPAATCGGWRRRSRRPRGPSATPIAVRNLGADTTVVVDGEILGKPRDDADAARDAARWPGDVTRCSPASASATAPARSGASRLTAVSFARAEPRKSRLVRRERGRARQGRRLRDSGAGVALHPADRGLVFECRRAAGGAAVARLTGGGSAPCIRR